MARIKPWQLSFIENIKISFRKIRWYFVSYYDYYQPELLPTSDTYIEKAMINEEIDRLRHQATSALMTRRDVIIVASVSCIITLVCRKLLRISASFGKWKINCARRFDKAIGKVQFKRTTGALKENFRLRGDTLK